MLQDKAKNLHQVSRSPITNLYTFLTITIIFTLILKSCMVESDSDKTVENEFFIDQETARIVAENLLFSEPSDVGSQQRELHVSDYRVSKIVESIEPLADNEGDNVMYIINYEESGFVILSADRRMEPILAHSTENHFNTKQALYNPGLVSWIDEFSTIIRKLRLSDQSLDRYLDSVWNSYIDSELDIMALGDEVLCNSTSYTVTIGPLLDTLWGQGCGYNEQVPHSCGGECGKAPTGCVATAMAQILKYHADRNWHGSYVNDDNAIVLARDWSGMPYTNVRLYPGTDVPTLMYDLGQYLGMNYSCDDGSSSNISSAHTAFIENFGFQTALRHDLDNISDYEMIIDEIDSSRPVYLRGNNTKDDEESFSWLFPTYGTGHAWVADGYSYRVNCDTGNTISNSYRIHMNWGWDGNSNGEFLKKSGDYPNHREMIYNLVPPPSN